MTKRVLVPPLLVVALTLAACAQQAAQARDEKPGSCHTET